ncbi:RNA polymerase II mediator complex subunit [Teratosphaeriaceae sp. CCFEE 6253]|nr:RNA polymerase II mediator complex subunit [Teratosphaeriaceae sp. CCFEE 6253]
MAEATLDEVETLIQNLVQLSQTSRRLPTRIPLDIIQYVELSRNPDIYTREFVELIMKYNQQLKGRTEAFASFRDILGREMASAIPEIKEDVQQIVALTGGKID